MNNPPPFSELPPVPSGKSGWPWALDTALPLPAEPAGGWPAITVVMPSYNQAEFLEEAIRSVLLQGYPNLQFVVFDGGSSDGSKEIIQKYEPWLDYWVSEKDRGQSDAINKGFARAEGDIWAWLNSDDVYEPGALALAASKLAGRKRAMLVGAAVVTDGPDALCGRPDARYPSHAEMLYEARTFPQPSTFWTRDLAEKAALPCGLLDEELHFVMDYDLWLRMRFYALETIFIPDLLSYERTHAGQKTLNHDERFDQERARVILRNAALRGEAARRWLLKSSMRRIWSGCRSGKLRRCRGSALQRAVRQQSIAMKKSDSV